MHRDRDRRKEEGGKRKEKGRGFKFTRLSQANIKKRRKGKDWKASQYTTPLPSSSHPIPWYRQYFNITASKMRVSW